MDLMNEITDALGWDAAMVLAGYWGGRTLYVPDKMTEEHEIAQVLGYEPALALVAAYGGELVAIPSMLRTIEHHRRVAAVRSLKRYSVPDGVISRALGLSRQRVQQIAGAPE